MSKFLNRSSLALLSVLIAGAAMAAPAARAPADNNGPPGGVRAMIAPRSAAPVTSNHGHFVCSAAIQSNGAVFSGEYVVAAQTTRIATGQYQVGFAAPCADVRIANGWFRVVQPDTLNIGTLPQTDCITADRYGVVNAVWIECYNQAGTPTDTSFTLSVSR